MIKLGKVGTIEISQSLKDSIDYHHKIFPGVEWGGLLFYKHVGGDFSELQNLKFVADNFYLMDKGTGTTTTHKFIGEDVTEAYGIVPEALESLMGEIHSHHTMKSFFSGTDLKDLEDNASVYGFYISLVVDVSGEYVCKVAIPIESEKTTMVGTSGEKIEMSKLSISNTLIGDLEVVLPEDKVIIPEWVLSRVKEINKKVVTASSIQNVGGFNNDPYLRKSYIHEKEPEVFPGFQKVTQSQIEQFVISLLTLEDITIKTVDKAVKVLNQNKSHKELEKYIDSLMFDIDILHFNVYGADFGMYAHLQEAARFMENHKPATWQLKRFVEALKSYKYV